ncbi:hypothetical protein BO86DRAFT_387898, partial [Aspergillus japonicus CBS 114.51]
MHSGRLRKAYVNQRRLCRDLSKKLQRSIALPLLGLQGPLPLPPLSCNPRGTPPPPQLASPRGDQAKTIYMQVYLSVIAPPPSPLVHFWSIDPRSSLHPSIVGREGWKRGDSDREIDQDNRQRHPQVYSLGWAHCSASQPISRNGLSLFSRKKFSARARTHRINQFTTPPPPSFPLVVQ